MGSYTDNLKRRGRGTSVRRPIDPKIERLTSAAIIRNGKHCIGFKTHYQIRESLGDKRCIESQDGDMEGFWTTKDRFVTRDEAREIAEISGQAVGLGTRTLLSSDINWNV